MEKCFRGSTGQSSFSRAELPCRHQIAMPWLAKPEPSEAKWWKVYTIGKKKNISVCSMIMRMLWQSSNLICTVLAVLVRVLSAIVYPLSMNNPLFFWLTSISVCDNKANCIFSSHASTSPKNLFCSRYCVTNLESYMKVVHPSKSFFLYYRSYE